ncbi:hypothetical protein LINPERHAP1_LOCUS12097, partial [Linum perenne]
SSGAVDHGESDRRRDRPVRPVDEDDGCVRKQQGGIQRPRVLPFRRLFQATCRGQRRRPPYVLHPLMRRRFGGRYGGGSVRDAEAEPRDTQVRVLALQADTKAMPSHQPPSFSQQGLLLLQRFRCT